MSTCAIIIPACIVMGYLGHKIGEIVDNIYSKISWKVIAYVFIAMFLFKSCQSCNRSNKIERIEKNTTVLVDSLIKSNDSFFIVVVVFK
jgi:hypothetical protein